MSRMTLVLCLTLVFGCESKNASILQKRVLTLAHEGELLSLDPQKKDDSVTLSVLGNIYEPLVRFDRDMKIISCLAERWENPNDLTWRFYLRRNVRFHNGKAFTAADVVYTIQRGLAGDAIKTYLIAVKGAHQIDSFTVDVFTDQPNPLLLNMLSYVYIIPSNEPPEKEIHHPIGTGPYTFQSEVAPQQVLLRANLNYWDTNPYIERVRFLHYASPEQSVEALLRGDVQVIRDFSENLIPRVQASGSAQVITRDSLAVTLLGFNLSGDPQQNPFLRAGVRKAIYFALDPQKLVLDALGGRANPAPQLVSPNVFGFDPNYSTPRRGLEKAKMLLAQAGYPTGFSSDIYGSVDEQRLQQLAEQLQGIGIKVQIHLLTWKDLYEKIMRHKLPMYTFTWDCSTGDASDFLNSCVHTPNSEAGYGNFNVASYSSPEADGLIEMSTQTLQMDERKILLQKALKRVQDDLPYVPLYSRYNHYGVSKELAWWPRSDGFLCASEMRWNP